MSGRKHGEKRRNCLLQAISGFLMMFSTAIYLQCIKMWHCMVIGSEISRFMLFGCEKAENPVV